MLNKIDIPGTDITLEIVDKTITITNKIEYDMQMHFRNTDADASLDTSGDVFEPLYWLDIKATPKMPTEYHTSLGIKREKRHLAELQKFFERGRFMASELRAIQSRALQKYNCHFESIVVEKNSVMGPNQQSMISIGIVTGIILGRLIADNVYFVNVSTWRKYWKFSYKDRSKKSMKLQAVAKVSDEFNLNVKDDEADAILIGSYFVNHGHEFGELESHKVS